MLPVWVSVYEDLIICRILVSYVVISGFRMISEPTVLI